MKIAIVGGGAAGFFLAIHLKQTVPENRVIIFERAGRVLAKVRVSGGGRCNLTNSFAHVDDLSHIYPRGARLMKRLLREFSHEDAYRWFEAHGVKLVTQDDDCVFPAVQDSAAVISCLTHQAGRLGVEVRLGHPVKAVKRHEEGGLEVLFSGEGHSAERFDRVAVTTGGAPRSEGFDYLAALGHKMETPCPSLYTFSILHKDLTAMMGLVVEAAQVSIPGTKFRSRGALLITHWGLSGPAILKLSSYAARHLHDAGYRSPLQVSWAGEVNMETVRGYLQKMLSDNPRKQLGTLHPYGLQQRLWLYLLRRCGLCEEQLCGELGGKSLNRLANVLTADAYAIEGKGTYRDECVTCGGVALSSVNALTMESRHCAGLYFAGEVLDVDAVTGGFNFQAAWTTAFVAARAMAAR